MTPETAKFREAMSRLGAAVTIVTSDGPAGRAGFTASAVCSVTDTPPTLLVCMNRGSSQHDAFRANATLCVNILRAGQEALSAQFADSAGGDARFGEPWLPGDGTGPVLRDAIASLGCVIDSATEIGTHTVLFAAVRTLHLGADGQALMYFRRAYHALPSPSASGIGPG